MSRDDRCRCRFAVVPEASDEITPECLARGRGAGPGIPRDFVHGRKTGSRGGRCLCGKLAVLLAKRSCGKAGQLWTAAPAPRRGVTRGHASSLGVHTRRPHRTLSLRPAALLTRAQLLPLGGLSPLRLPQPGFLPLPQESGPISLPSLSSGSFPASLAPLGPSLSPLDSGVILSPLMKIMTEIFTCPGPNPAVCERSWGLREEFPQAVTETPAGSTPVSVGPRGGSSPSPP